MRVPWTEMCEPLQRQVGILPADEAREMFYNMVRRHLRDVPDQPTTAKRGRKSRKLPISIEAPPEPGRDGQAYEPNPWVNDENTLTKRNAVPDALEWLSRKQKLALTVGRSSQQELEQKQSLIKERYRTADDLMTLFQKAQLTPLRSFDPGGVSGGSFGPRYVGMSKLAAMMKLGDIRSDIPPAAMALLERILLANEHVWHDLPKKRQDQVFNEIRMALDFARWSLDRLHGKEGQIMTGCKATAELVQRWPDALEWVTAKRLARATLAFRMDRRRA